MDQILELFHLDDDDDILDINLLMIQDWLLVAPFSNFIQYLLCCFIKKEEQMLLS